MLAQQVMACAPPPVPCCRYDNLVGMFSGKQVPAVGISIGIERIFALLEQKWRSQGDIRERETQVRWTVHATLPGSAEASCIGFSQGRCSDPAGQLHCCSWL